MNKMVSIIIPVYNVEKYIEQCLISIINQSYKNLEIILIDDGSLDQSGNICDLYQNKDNRVKVFHKKNGGSASAKNLGLRKVSGDYVMFVDSDDFIDRDTIRSVVNLLEQEKADIVQTNLVEIFKDTNKLEDTSKNIKIYNKEEFLSEYLNNWKNALFCNKIYKKEVLKNIFFIEGRYIDDEFFTYRVVLNANKIITYDLNTYYYRQRKSSVMGNLEFRKFILRDQIDFIYLRFLEIDKKIPSLKNIYIENLIDTYLIFSKSPYLEEGTLKYLKLKIKSILGKILSYRLKNNALKLFIIKLLFTSNNKILKNKNGINSIEYNLERYFE